MERRTPCVSGPVAVVMDLERAFGESLKSDTVFVTLGGKWLSGGGGSARLLSLHAYSERQHDD